MKRFLIICICCFVLLSCAKDNQLKIGVLVDESGDWKSVGIAAKAALQLKQEQLQDFLSKSGSELELKLSFANTKSEPELALKYVKEFHNKGIKLLIGPATSQEVAAVADFVNKNDMLVMSYASTANKLTLSGDNIFRYVTTDLNQSRAIDKYLKNNNIKYLWQIYREDLGNRSLTNMVHMQFSNTGGKTVNRFVYNPQQTDFTKILNQISAEIEQKKLAECAVYVAGFDEYVEIFEQTSAITLLSDVLWVGGDGTAKLNAILKNDTALMFALNTKFTAPINAQTDRLKYRKFVLTIEEMIGYAPNSYALAAADILQIITYSSGICSFPKELKNTIYNYSAKNYGLTGNTKLNKNGDRDDWGYDLWQIKDTIAGYRWKPIYSFKQNKLRNLFNSEN